MKNRISKDLVLANVFTVLLIIVSILLITTPQLPYLALLRNVTFILMIFFSVRYMKKAKKKHFLYDTDRKKHVRNWLVFTITIITTIALVSIIMMFRS